MEDTLIPIFALIVTIGLPVSIPIVIAVLNYKKRRQLVQLNHIERMAAIERGMEIPPLPLEFIEGRVRRRRSALLPGLIWFFVGITTWLFLMGVSPEDAMIGLIPAGVGVAYLIYYFIEGRNVEAEARVQDGPGSMGQLPR